MFKYRTLLYNLIVFSKKERESSPIYFLSEEDHKLGQLFIIGKLETNDKPFKKTIDYLTNFIENNYFSQVISNPEIALENVLQRANEEWQIEISKYKHGWDEETLRTQLKKLVLLIGVIKENEVYFVYVNKAHVFLIRDNKIVDILTSMEKNKKINPFKPFTDIVSGHLKINDRVFFCFNDMLDYFSPEKIKRVVKDYSPSKAGQYFQDLLYSTDSQKIFTATILGIYPKKTKEMSTSVFQVPVTSNDSMQQLALKQQNTENFIHPSAFPSIAATIKVLGVKIKKIINNKNIKRIINNKNIKFAKEKIDKTFFSFSKNRLAKIFPAIKNIIHQLTRFIKFPKPKIVKIKLSSINFFAIKKEKKLLGIPKKNKLYLIVGFVIIFILIFGVIFSISHQVSKKEQERYDNLAKQIEEKHSLAEAALIYGNKDKAKTLLQEAQTLLAKMPQNKPERQEKYQQLIKKNQEQLDKILKLYNLENPELIANFTSATSEINVSNVLLFNNVIYLWPAGADGQGNKLYRLDLDSKQISEQASIKQDYGAIKHGAILNKDNLLFYTQNKKFVRFNIKEKAFYDFNVEVNHEFGDVQAIVIYGTRLYVLDKTNNQIYKYSKTNSGLGKETAWIQDQTNIQEFENIAIDGDIWGIKNNGEIIKMFTGKKQAWSASIEPALSSPTKIYTELDYKYLYILDPSSQRLVTLDKDGKIFKQFKSDKFNDLKDFSVNEPAGKVYLLNGTSIYQIDLSATS